MNQLINIKKLMFSNFLYKIVFVLFCFAFTSCVTAAPPLKEYVLAKAAIDAAKSVQAARYSPGFWHQAEEYYRKAKIYYGDKEFELATQYFILARTSAEKAENSSRLLKQKSGDVL